ncbi:MAG: hypothetical protein NWE92_06515 [Candidatus Bathyarchaeota archaeon]|nr:hypothetical protein [Candidatus Bathyarchaeota archaeon]
MKRKQTTIIPASIILIVLCLCTTIPIQPTDAKVAPIPVIVVTDNAAKALVDAGNGDLTFYETIEHIIQDGDLVNKSIVPAYFPTSIASNFSAISPHFNPESVLKDNLTTVSKCGTRFYTGNGCDYSPWNYGNKTLYAPTETIEINSLGVNLQVTYNSTEEPIFIENQYSQLFGIITIIDAPAPTPNGQEYLIAAIILLLVLIPLLAYLIIRRNTKTHNARKSEGKESLR